MSDALTLVLVGASSFVLGLSIYACSHASSSMWGPLEDRDNERCGFYLPWITKRNSRTDTQIQLIP